MNDTVNDAVEQANETAVDTTPPTVISVDNPNEEEMGVIRKGIKANFNFDVIVKAIAFNFKKYKDKATNIEIIRESVQLAIPYPSVEGLINIIEGKHVPEGEANKGLDLLLECMETVVNQAARELLHDEEVGKTLNAANFPTEKLAWEFLANIPKVQRRGGGIPKETWEAFAADYIAIMPDITGKNIEATTNCAKLLQSKLGTIKTNRDVLEFVITQLAIYADNSPQIEDYQECVGFLLGKADDLLNTKPADLLANL